MSRVESKKSRMLRMLIIESGFLSRVECRG